MSCDVGILVHLRNLGSVNGSECNEIIFGQFFVAIDGICTCDPKKNELKIA